MPTDAPQRAIAWLAFASAWVALFCATGTVLMALRRGPPDAPTAATEASCRGDMPAEIPRAVRGVDI